MDIIIHLFNWLCSTDPNVSVACVFGLLGGLGGAAGGGGGLLGTVFSAAGQVASFQAQQAQADAQIKQQERFIRDRQESLRLQQESIRLRQSQEQEKEARERFNAQLQGRKAISTARASAAEGGVVGLSVDALTQDFEFQNALFNEASFARERAFDQQSDLQARSANAQYTFDLNRQLTPVERPSFAGAALRIGANVLGGLRG